MDHIRIVLEEDVAFDQLTTGFEHYQLVHCALPDLDLARVDPSTTFLGKALRLPLLISSMTGGVDLAREINCRLAEAAQQAGIALALGSFRPVLRDPARLPSFKVRDVAPDVLLLANIGVVQLKDGCEVDQCRRVVEELQADALILHLNALQEALQPEGQPYFSGLLAHVEAVCRRLPVPVVVKEVGWGIAQETARQLAEAGVAAIDVAGAGGTSWSQVEMYRAQSQEQAQVAAAFRDWGLPTTVSLRMARRGAPHLPIVASGGVRTGIDVAKAIALGASLCGIAAPFLGRAVRSTEAVLDLIEELGATLRVAMFASNCPDLSALSRAPLLNTRTWNLVNA